MKIKTISRLEEDYTRKTSKDIYRMQRNYTPEAHPFEKAREYKRAMNATKLERVFAKPFVNQLDGHRDGVYTLAKHPSNLQTVISGACDGEVKIWNLATMKNKWSVSAHKGYVRGITIHPNGETYYTCSDDKSIKKWKLEDLEHESDKTIPIQNWLGKNAFTSITHHQRKKLFATGGSTVNLWDEHRSEPMDKYAWQGTETITSVKFNPVEVDVIASSGSDRGITLHDIRMSTPIKKLVLSMRTNQICWNPMEAFNFTTANEDSNLYTFDMRKLDIASNIHKDHVSAVLTVDYCPTGKSFVSGSYDRSLRIFDYDKGHSRDIYHTSRMQRIFNVMWSPDSKYLLTASDETNIRIWKANASERVGATLRPREKAAIAYNEKLKERYQYHPEIKRIARHRHVPRAIKDSREKKRIMIESAKRKEDNRRKHSKPGRVPYKVDRKKNIVDVED